MDRDRVVRVWASIRERARDEAVPVSVRHVCLACARAVDAAAVTVAVARAPGMSEPVIATGPDGEKLAELQSTLGEGPCVDALRGPGPVLVADLASTGSRRRWPVFAPGASERGVRAVFAFPLLAGAIRVGVLEVYHSRVGLLPQRELADALVYADAATLLVLGAGDGGDVARASVTGDGFDERRAVVHQAAGMISVQLGVGVEEALVRLRARAYTEDRRLAEMARDVVDSRLRFGLDDVERSATDEGIPGKEALP